MDQNRTVTRRHLMRGAVALGGATALTSAGAVRPLIGRARQESGFTREASIVSWGFGVQETNPLAFARVDAFKAAFPNIQLEVVEQNSDEKMLTAIASDSLPDLLWLDRFATTSWASRGVLMPLTEFIERDGYDTSRFYESALNEASYDGQIYGIPGGMDVQALYANTDALAEIGVDPATIDTANWDQLSDVGSQLLKKNGDTVERWGFDHRMQGGFIHLWGGVNGGVFINEDGTEVTYDDPKIVEALDWGVRAYDAQGGFQSYEAVSGAWGPDEQVARGQVGMSMYQSWLLGVIARVNPAVNFTVLPIKMRSGEGNLSIAGGRAWFIPADAKDPEAAWEFIKFMHSDETWLVGANAVKAARQAEGAPYVPSLTGSTTADQAQIDQVYEEVDPKFDQAVQLFPQLLQASRPRSVYISPVGNTIDTILTDDGVKPALRKEKSAEEALQTADQAAQDEIDFQ